MKSEFIEIGLILRSFIRSFIRSFKGVFRPSTRGCVQSQQTETNRDRPEKMWEAPRDTMTVMFNPLSEGRSS